MTRTMPFDPKALQRKYDEERDKRLSYKPQGTEEYQSMNESFSAMLSDPYAQGAVERPPRYDQCDVLVIGGGFGGQLTAVRLLEQGITNFRIVEKGADFGGTWYWNRYPGAQCDIESYVYMPLLEQTGSMPTEKYAHGPELLEHSRRIGRTYGLYQKTLFRTEVKKLNWDDRSSTWEAYTDREDQLTARFVVPVAGPLHRPKLPGVPGLDKFAGHTFHTSRWDYDYTGGDTFGNLSKLQDKRVGIIGTGATAVQIVPHLGQWSKDLYVFQRTPSSIDVRNNSKTDAQWAEGLGHNWQRARMDNFNTIVNGGKQDVDMVHDGWTDLLTRIAGTRRSKDSQTSKAVREANRQMLDFEKMEQIRGRVDSIVQDPATAESLKPYYNQFCKRPCFHDDYLKTFNLPNVHLIDTEGKGVDRITPKGIVANGKEYDLDCIVFATGFELATSWTQRAGIEIFGRNSISLTDKWRDGMSTLHGHSTRDFPNCFFISINQAGNSPNFLHMTGDQAEHISYIIKETMERGAHAAVEATKEAEEQWTQTIVNSGERRRAFRQACTPSYLNNEGKTSMRAAKNGSYGGGALEFLGILQDWKNEGSMVGLEVHV